METTAERRAESVGCVGLSRRARACRGIWPTIYGTTTSPAAKVGSLWYLVSQGTQFLAGLSACGGLFSCRVSMQGAIT